jgi:hypothetical protein
MSDAKKVQMNLATATPAEIDTRLVELERAFASLLIKRDALERMRESRYATETSRAEAQVEIDALTEKMRTVDEELDEIAAEFNRRGGWSRVWLVPGGHAHRSKGCHSLYAETELVLCPRDIRKRDLSGATEKEIVEAAGDRACTHCYPSAPVEPRPSTIILDSEDEKAKARAEREVKRQEAAAKKAAKAITHPDGTRIKHDIWYVETEAEAQRIYVQTHADAAWNAYGIGAARHAEKQAEVECLLIAIAHKHGETVEQARERLAPKIAAKAKRDKR